MENDHSSKLEPLVPRFRSTVPEGEEGLNLFDFLVSIRRRWLTVTITTLIVAVLTLFWSVTRPASFRSKFQILVEPVTAEGEVVAAVTGESKTVLDQDLGETQVSKAELDYDTQLQVLISRKLLEPVASKLEFQFPTIDYELLKSKLAISRLSSNSKIIQVEYQAGTPDEVEQVLSAVSRAYMAYSLTERQSNIKRAIEFTDNQLPTLKVEVQELEQQLQAFSEQNLITDPQVYSEDLARRAFELERKLSDTRIELQRKRQILVSLQQQTQFQAKSGEVASVLSTAPYYQKLLGQLQDIEAEIELKSATLTQNNPIIQDLIEERRRILPLVQQAAEASAGSQLPSNVGTSEGVPFQNNLRQSLIQQLVETEIAVKELRAVEKALTQNYESLQTRLITLPKINRVYDSLKRQLTIASDNLENFQKVRANLLINAARQEVPWELIEEPSDAKRVIFSSIPRDISLGVMLGLLLGSGIAILLDKVRNTINTLDELRQKTQLPILATIPFEQNLKATDSTSLSLMPNYDQANKREEGEPLTLLHDKPPILEAFQSLYISIRTLKIDTPIRSVVVSSCLQGEGKSTVAVCLAQAAAALGQRVLLVDMNLRSPIIHQKFLLPQNPGVTEMLALGNSPNSTIHMIEQCQNLYVLTAGTQIQGYSKYLVSEKIQDLMTELHNGFFDFVIYDTLSLVLQDALLLCPNTDGLLLTVGLGKIDEKSLQDLAYKIKSVKVKTIGIVANNIEDPKFI